MPQYPCLPPHNCFLTEQETVLPPKPQHDLTCVEINADSTSKAKFGGTNEEINLSDRIIKRDVMTILVDVECAGNFTTLCGISLRSAELCFFCFALCY